MADVKLSNCLSAELGASHCLRWMVLRGEVDLSSANVLRTTLLSEGAPTVIVDLSGVSFIDVLGVGVLLSAHQSLQRRGGQVVLRHPAPQPRRVFEMLGLGELLDACAA